MDLIKTEKKWQEIWNKKKLSKFDENSNKPKYYVLEMFSYPSGAKLHMGHWYNYAPSDSFARFKKMQGYNVFQPMGFDAFGLPAENYAIKTGIHPKDSTYQNIETMEKQLKAIGGMFNWDAEIKTCGEDYYKWTQWMFLKFLEKGLAYRKNAPVNFCPSCKTVLANEQVLSDGTCERCGKVVVKKNLVQWFLKITEYAEELLNELDQLDWPEKTKLMQKNWIGKSVGAEIIFKTESCAEFGVFTTRPDTLFGVSYVVFAPEHPMVKELTTKEQKPKIDNYISETNKITDIDRMSTTREKTGVFTGSYAINPINGQKVPIYISDYVLLSYGTGIVMGVPAHDERDFVFASKYKLPITQVIKGKNDEPLPYVLDGTMVNSREFDKLNSSVAKEKIVEKLESKNLGRKKINYKLRDWLISRQRYWGTPIPVIHCEHCGIVPVPEKDLPVKLPYDVEFKPDGKSPLSKCRSFINTVCPKCKKPSLRDPDTMDTFLCSSWYFLRYADAHNASKPFDSGKINSMLPVDKYIGGAEHACMHLLYARFFTKVLRDLGYLNFCEPFKSLVHQGTILGPDGNKMSKSKGNIISPDKYVESFGSDVLRLYLMFGFSYIDGGPWNDDGIKSTARFLDRIERMVVKYYSNNLETSDKISNEEDELKYALNYAITKVSSDLEIFSFNTAVARLMELVNAIYKYDNLEKIKNVNLVKDVLKNLILLTAPLAPHFSEELWEQIGQPFSIFNQSYPKCDESALKTKSVEIVIQINSKIKTKLLIPTDLSDKETENLILNDDKVKALIFGQCVKKFIVIKNRLVNIII
ncbi:MAG: leucine--tRNA ligase [Firmicutes bacterium]|nr:leucine--tRNA ligase [Bacillota bacterium]